MSQLELLELRRQERELIRDLQNNIREFKIMSEALNKAVSDLKAEVAQLTTVKESVVAFVLGVPKLIADAIANATDDSAAVAAVNDALGTIKGDADGIAAALVANTPAAPAPPAATTPTEPAPAATPVPETVPDPPPVPSTPAT